MMTAFWNGEISLDDLMPHLELAQQARAAMQDPANRTPNGNYRLPNGSHIRAFTGITDENGNYTIAIDTSATDSES